MKKGGGGPLGVEGARDVDTLLVGVEEEIGEAENFCSLSLAGLDVLFFGLLIG